MNNIQLRSFAVGFGSGMLTLWFSASIAVKLYKADTEPSAPDPEPTIERRLHELEQTQALLLYKIESLEKKADTALERIYRYNGGLLP